MLKRRAIFLFSIALLLGLGAAWMANNWLQQRKAPEVATVATTSVVVAALDIPFAQRIEPVHLKTVSWPAANMPSDAFRTIEEVAGKISSQKLVAGEVLLKSRVVDEVGGSTLAALLTPGKRAMSVRVNDVIGVAGFLLPNNRVDVISAKVVDDRAITSTALEDIKVLAVDQTVSPDKKDPVIVRAVTLEVSPEEAEKLVKVTQEGSVQLALRNPVEQKEAPKPQPMRKVVVVRRSPPPAPAPAPAPAPVPVPVVDTKEVTVIRGTVVDVSKIRL